MTSNPHPPFSRPREKVPEGRMRADAQSAAEERPGRAAAAHPRLAAPALIRRVPRHLLPQAGEGFR
jgi:hypothetical protein